MPVQDDSSLIDSSLSKETKDSGSITDLIGAALQRSEELAYGSMDNQMIYRAEDLEPLAIFREDPPQQEDSDESYLDLVAFASLW